MLLAEETSTLYGAIGVTGVAVSVLYSLGVAFVTLWLFVEADYNAEEAVFVLGFAFWIFGVAGILFVTTVIQGLVAG